MEPGGRIVADPTILSGEFHKAHDLAERLYEMQKEQADRMLAQLTYHGETLNTMKTDITVIKANTDGLPARVLMLENLRYKAMAFVAASMFFMWIIQAVVSYFKH